MNLAIIQARIKSERLPAKVLRRLHDRTVLELCYQNVCKSNADHVVIATPDDEIIEECIRIGAEYFKGSENNVLERYYQCAKKYKAKNVIRITSDCPFIDPFVINLAIESHTVDYTGNGLIRTFPRGMDCEIFTFQTLEKTYFEASQDIELEHVTPYIYQSGKFKIKHFYNKKDTSYIRVTLDQIEDYLVMEKIVRIIKPTLANIENLYETNPEFFETNKNVKQKKI